MKYAYLVLTLLIPLQSQAETKIVVSVGYGFAVGGGNIVGDKKAFEFPRVNSRLQAGEGRIAEFGFELPIGEKSALRFLIGRKNASMSKEGIAEYEISSFPASVLYLHSVKNITFGGGVTYHISPTYTARSKNSVSLDDTANFDNAIGFSALVNFRLTRSDLFSIGIRYTQISYEGAQAPNSNSSLSTVRSKSSYNANSLAIAGIFKF